MIVSPTQIAQRQLDAYNSRDIEAFISVFHEEAEVFELGQTLPRMKGKADIQKQYADLFAHSPGLHAHIVNRTVLGNTVIDFEQITGRLGDPNTLELVAIYQMQDGLIRRSFFIRKN